MSANDSKSYFGFSNILVDKYNNTYHCFTDIKAIDADYSALTWRIQKISQAPKFKVGDRVRITIYKNIFSKGCTGKWSKQIFVIDSFLKTNPWVYRSKWGNTNMKFLWKRIILE